MELINDTGANKTLTETGQPNEEFFKNLREMIYSCGGSLLTAGNNDQHFALDGKQYNIKLSILGDDF